MTQALARQNLGKGYSATTPVKVPKVWSFWKNQTQVREASRLGQARGHDVWESSKVDKSGTRAKALEEKRGSPEGRRCLAETEKLKASGEVVRKEQW